MSEADDFNAQAAALSPPGSPGPGRQPDVSPEELARQFPGEDENNGSPEYAARVAALAAQYNSPAAAEARKHVTPATGLREGLEGIPGAADRIKGPAQARPAAFDMDSAVAAMSAPVADVSQNPGKVDTSSTARSQDSDSDTSGFDMGAAAAAMEPPPEPAKPFDPAEGMSEAEKGAASGVSQVMQLPSALKLLGASMQHSAAARTIKQFDDLDSGVPWEKTDDVKKGYANPFTRMYAGADPDQKAELRQNMVDELTSSKANQQAAATTWLAYAKEQQGLRGRVPSLQDVRDVKGFGAWLANKGVSNAISLAPIIAASAIPVVGPALGGAGIVAQTVAGEAGRYAGAGAAANPENPEAGAASGVEQNVPRIATAGAVNSALNFAGPVGRFATGAAPAVGGVIRRAATGAAEQGAIGAAQTAVSDVAAGKTPDLAEIGEAGLLGAVVGGPLGAMHRAQKETLQNIATADDPVAAALAGTRSHDAAFAELTSNLADTLNTHLAPDVPQLEYKQKTDGEVLDANGLPPRGEGEGQLPAPEPQPLLPHYTSAPEQINATGFDHEAAAAAMEGAHGDQELQPPEPLPRPEPAEPHGMEALAPQTEQGGMAAPDITKPLESRGQREPGTLYAGPGGRDVEAVGIHQLPERTASQPVEGVSRGDAQAAQQMLRAIGKRLQVFKGDNAFFDPKDPNTIHVGDGVKAPILAVVGHEIKHVIDSHFPELSKAFDDELRSHLTPEQAEAFKSETHTPEEIAATKPGELHENYGFNEFSSDTFGAMWQNKNFFSDVFARARELGVEDRFPGTLGKVGALIVRLTRTMMKGLKAPSGNERFASVDGLRNVQSLHDKAVDAMARYYKEQQRPAREMESQRLRDAHEVSRIPLSTRRELHPSITRKDNGKPNGNEQQAGASAQGGRGQDVLRNAQTGNELQGDAGQDQNRVADARPLSSRPEREDSESVKPLEGSPPGNKPSAAIREVARKYMADAGLPYDPPTRYAKVDPARAKRVADAYEAMKHNPNDPEVKSAYEALARETIAQYDAMTKAGVKVDFMKPGENPYPNPRRAINDLHENNHLSVYPTESGFGTEGAPDRSDNPLLADSGRTIGGKPAAVNDLFRAVHDYFGHAKEGVGFRADGEENAWRMHSAMFSPEARRAMTSETRGQNSWVNYGSHGEFNKTASQEATKYADQKTGLLPKWASEDGVKESRAGKAPPKPAGEKLREDIDFTTNGVNHLANQRALLDADGLSWAHENTLYSHDSSLPSGVGANASYNVRTGRYEIRVRPGYINEAPPGELAMTLYHEHMHVIDWNGNLYSDHPQFDPAKEGTAARELVDLYNKTSDRELKQFLRYPLNDLAHPGMHTAGNEWKLRAELFAQAATLNNHPRYSEILQNEAPAAKKFLDAAIAHAAELGHIPGTDSTTEQARLAKSFDQRLRSVSKGAAGNDVQRSPAGNAGDGKGLLESRADRHDRIEKATSLTPILKGDEAVPKLKTLRDVGDYLDKRASKLLRGLDLSRDTPENRTAIAATIHGEASEALKQEGHAGEWYRDTLSKAMDTAAEVYPEIKSDPKHEFAFKTALAVTSNGQTIPENVRMAFESYKRYRETGELGTDFQGGGERGRTMRATIDMHNSLARQMGEDALRETLMSKLPVREIESRFGAKLAELKDQSVYGGSIYGPKIGGGFLPNLMGKYDTIAIDRWLMRSWGRLTGNLRTDVGNSGLQDDPLSGGQRAYIRGTMNEALDVLHADHPDLTHAGLQATLWYPEKQLYDKFGVIDKRGTPTDYAQEIEKYVQENHPDRQPAGGSERGGGSAPGLQHEPTGAQGLEDNLRRVSDEDFLNESRAAKDPIAAIKDNPEDGLRRPGWGVLTATRESVGPHNHPDNVAANRALEDELVSRGLQHERIAGSYAGVDQGPNYLVAADRDTLHGLRDKYGQGSVLTNRGLEHSDGTITPALHDQNTYGPDAEKQGFFSRLSNGKPFAMGMDWEGRVADTGHRPDNAVPSTLHESRAAKEVRSEWDGYSDLSPAQRASLTKVGAIVDPLTLKQRWDAKTADWRDRTVTGLVDDFRPLMKLDPTRKVSTAYMMAKLSRGYNGTMEALLRYGKIKLTDGVPDVDVNDPTGGFGKVLADLKGETQRALMWVAAQRAGELKANGLENLFDAADITNLKGLSQGKMADGRSRADVYGKFLKNLTDYNNAALDMAQQSGLITGDVAKLFRDHPYIPFYRVQEDIGQGALTPFSKSGLSDQKAWRKLKGGTNALNSDLLENVLGNWAHIFQSAAKNRAALATVDTLLKHHTDVIEVIPPGREAPKGSFQVMRDGVGERYLIHDPLVADAVSTFNYVQPGWMKALGKPKQLLTAGITFSPIFRTRIAIREALASLIQSPIGTNPVKNVIQGWRNTDAKSAIFASTMASGAQIRFGSSERSIGALKLADKLSNVHANDSVMASLGRQIGSLWDAYHELGNKTENFNRTALYEQLRNKTNPETGVKYTHAEAAFAARDLLDFSAGGKWAAVKFLSSTVPFMNARAQGLYSIGKTAGNDPHGVFSIQNKVTAVTLAACSASLALMLAQKDDDWWKQRTQQDRDAYWAFKIGNHVFRIPKPFELGAAASMAERTWELATDRDMTLRKYGSNFGQVLMNSLSFDPTPQFVKPLISIYANKDPTTQAPIETTADQQELPGDRYDERTSMVARYLGQLGIPNPMALAQATYSPLSPKQIDYLIGGYTSSYGLMAAATLDYAHAAATGQQRPALTLKQMTGSYASDIPEASSRYVQEMHEHLRGIEEAYASYSEAEKRGDVESAKRVLAEHGSELREHGVAGEVTKQLGAINTMVKRVEASHLSADEKRAMLNQLAQKRNDIAKRFQDATSN